MNRVVRRVVTAQSVRGSAVISSDVVAPVVFPLDGVTLTELWKTSATPAQLRTDDEEPAAGPLSINPPKNGSLFRIADIPPDKKDRSAEEGRKLFEQMGNAAASTASAGDNAHGAMMHRTATIDYGIVLEGEITLVVDSGEVDLKAGDVVVQRGANHAWSNRSDKVCRMAFIMIDALYPLD
jgi:mannose-6-phosphate isomerase-like protein (cupin superfamily)